MSHSRPLKKETRGIHVFVIEARGRRKNVQVTHYRRRASVQLSDSVKDLYMQQSHVLKTKLSTTDVLTNLYVSIEAFIRQVAKTC